MPSAPGQSPSLPPWARCDPSLTLCMPNNATLVLILRGFGEQRDGKRIVAFLFLSSLLDILRASAAQGGPALRRFILCFAFRNAVLEADFAKKGYKLPTARKTGTTIAGVVYKVSRDRPAAAAVTAAATVVPVISVGSSLYPGPGLGHGHSPGLHPYTALQPHLPCSPQYLTHPAHPAHPMPHMPRPAVFPVPSSAYPQVRPVFCWGVGHVGEH